MQGDPKVTVLMSVYNGESFLREAIESILNQTFKDFEFLIINDGSTDSSRDIILSYNDPRIRLVDNEQNIGLTRSLNKGLKLARGEYIARMDADDISMKDRLEKEIKILDQNKKIGLVGTYYYIINEKGEEIKLKKTLTDSEELNKKILTWNQFAHGSVMFRKKCIEKVGPYREVFKASQDYDLWLRIADFYDLINIPSPLYKWRFHFGNVSINPEYQHYFAYLAIELAEERKKSGKDRFQIRKNNNIYAEQLSNIASQKRTSAYSYYYWASILYSGKDYASALKLLLRSIKINPLLLHSWLLITKALLNYLFYKPLIKCFNFNDNIKK